MDIQILDKKSLKIKTKNSVLIVNPSSSIQKTEADALIAYGVEKSDSSKVLGYRLFIDGPGEYEVNGVKITGMDAKGDAVYLIDADSIKILLGKTSSILGISDRLSEVHIAILDVDVADDSIIAKIEPKVTVVFGSEKNEFFKKIGKEEDFSAVSKYSMAYDKLPGEMEVVNLE